ncbi:hypothetical protein QCA50_017811 [Cerrena zonata]
MTIDHAAKVYSTCRKAMITLGASSTLLDKYKVLRKEDLAASTAVVDPNARGQSQAELSWIWQTSTQSSSTPEFMEEMLRVNWLRAKARRDRWKEEKILLKSEMQWTRNYFKHTEKTWLDRSKDTTVGAECYALRQAYNWRRFAHLAQKALETMDHA